MNGQQHRDDIVARWIDDGPEAAPERFVWAALEQVDRTPQRSAWRVALENMPMYTKLAIPVVAAAAVLFIAVALGALNNQSNVGGSPTPEATPAATPSPSPAPEACGVNPASGGGLHVVWCVPRGNDRMVVDFTFDAPADWADQTFASVQTLYLLPTEGAHIAIGRSGPDTIDAWRDEILATEAFDVTEPESITLDGIEGYVLDVRLAEGVAPIDAPPVLDDTEQAFVIGEGNVARVWLVAFPDEALAIVTVASDDEFESWAGAVSDAVDTIQWAP